MKARRRFDRRDSSLFETIALGVVFLGADGCIETANPAALRILGVSMDQIEGRSFQDPLWRAISEDGTNLPGEQHPAMVALRTGCEARDAVIGVFNPSRDVYTWISVSAVPLFKDGKATPSEVLACFSDVSASKSVEAALRESEERYQRITEGLTDYLYTVDVCDGRAVGTVHSQACEAVTGYTRQEFAADPYLWIRMVAPEDRDLVIGHVARILTGERAAPLEHRITRKDGQVRWVLDTTIAHIDAEGRFVSYDGVVNDITDRKRAEQLDLELQRRLLQAQKLESLGLMAGGIAHDFNNLLMGIMGNLEVTLMKLGPSDGVRPRIEQAHQAACRAAELAGQMLAYTGRGLFVVSDLNLNTLVLESAQLLRSTISTKAVTLSLQLDREIPTVRGDLAQFQQVVMNLLANAAEAIDDGPGSVTIATGVVECDREHLNRSVIEQKPAPGRFVRLDVSDTGAGIDAETRQRMFDPFFSTKFTGRGLGLAAVLGIVKGHGGAIMVDSEVGRGTTMRVLLPVGAAILSAGSA